MTRADALRSVVLDVLAECPGAARVFIERGMACAGCTFARFETVAEVAAVYGCDAYELACALVPADARELQRKDRVRKDRVMTITETTTITDIASALPASVRVFQRHGIDFCCGGKKPLSVACRERGLSFTEIATAIEASTAAGTGEKRNWSREPLGALISHIVTTYHGPLREELPRLEAMARKVAEVHGGRAPNFTRVREIVTALSAELVAHMRKEELVLFPAIDAIEAGTQSIWPLSAPIAIMEDEHEHAGALLAELRELTEGYEPPDWGCATVRALYHGLAELESSMHLHVHLENNVLFPRALHLALR